jgi:TatD DNase family protein
MTLQAKMLRKQLQMALQWRKTAILHVRDEICDLSSLDNAYGLVIRILEEEKVNGIPIIFHCFSGSAEYLRAALAIPESYISFAGNVTFKSARELRELLVGVPAGRLLLETDAPFLAPEPQRGSSNHPQFLIHIAEVAASLGIDLDSVTAASSSVFGFNIV